MFFPLSVTFFLLMIQTFPICHLKGLTNACQYIWSKKYILLKKNSKIRQLRFSNFNLLSMLRHCVLCEIDIEQQFIVGCVIYIVTVWEHPEPGTWIIDNHIHQDTRESLSTSPTTPRIYSFVQIFVCFRSSQFVAAFSPPTATSRSV